MIHRNSFRNRGASVISKKPKDYRTPESPYNTLSKLRNNLSKITGLEHGSIDLNRKGRSISRKNTSRKSTN